MDLALGAFTVELQVVIEAMELFAQLGAIRIVIETESMLLAHAVNRCEPDFSMLFRWKI